jgi:hypothetical protein
MLHDFPNFFVTENSELFIIIISELLVWDCFNILLTPKEKGLYDFAIIGHVENKRKN